MTVIREKWERVRANRGVKPAPVLTLAFWRLFAIEMRPYLMFVSAFTGLAGMAFAPDIAVPDLLLLTALFFLAYGFGQALTDCFQTDTDALSAPYRPLAQGRLRERDVLIVSLAGLIAGGMVLTAYSLLNRALVGAGVAGLATYTWFKRRWWGGPFYNAWIVADLCLIGYASALGATGASLDLTVELGAALLTVLLAYANFVLAGYFKDVSADRASGYKTMPVVFGMRASAFASDTLAVLALLAAAGTIAMVLPPGFGGEHLPALACLGGAAAWSAVAQKRLHEVTSEDEAHRAITPVVHAYILMLAGICLALRPEWSPLPAVLYAGFFLVLAQRPMKEQV